MLIKEPKAISLSDLLRRVDGPIAPLPCLSRQAYQRCDDCADEATCRLRELFGQVFWSYLLLIELLTLDDLVRRRRPRRPDSSPGGGARENNLLQSRLTLA